MANRKAISAEFIAVASEQTIIKALIRLSAGVGEAYQTDDKMGKLMAAEWIKAVGKRSAKSIELAVDHWIATQTRFPKPAQIIALADEMFDKEVKHAVQQFGLHEARVHLPSSFREFRTLKVAEELRGNSTWAKWLNSIHPLAEDQYFHDAKFDQFEHVIVVSSAFTKDYILSRYSELLEKAFGRKIVVKIAS